MSYLFFWGSLFLIVYTYFGYPVILYIASTLYNRHVKKQEVYFKVSLIMAVYNEEARVENKIRNCLSLDYPKDKFEILIGSDGSSDKTNDIIGKYISQAIKLFELPIRQGKPAVLNRLVSEASGEILVFTDARQVFEASAIKELVANFADERVGCVSGELVLKKNDKSTVGEGLSFYWNYEKMMRYYESKTDSMIGATGAIYALRKSLYTVLPVDTVLDDVFLPMKAVEKGYRAVFERSAIAYDEVSKDAAQESRRKIRTLAGNWQLIVRLNAMLNPMRYPIAWKFISHKVMRLIMPYFMLCLLLSDIFLYDLLFYKIVLWTQLMFYLTALLGYLFKKVNIKLIKIPYTFCLLNINAIQGLYMFLTTKQSAVWEKT